MTKPAANRRAAGPKGSPLFGNAREFRRDPLNQLVRWAQEYGELTHFKIGPLNCCLVDNPEYVQHVLTTNAANYSKGRRTKLLKIVIGEGLLTSEGELWKRQRRLAQP